MFTSQNVYLPKSPAGAGGSSSDLLIPSQILGPTDAEEKTETSRATDIRLRWSREEKDAWALQTFGSAGAGHRWNLVDRSIPTWKAD